MDVEGTTTSKDFVFKVLFPFAYEMLPTFLKENFKNQNPEVLNLINVLKAELVQPDLSLEAIVEILRSWINEDKKHAVLKSLQGLIWEDGYKSGKLKSHIYDEVSKCFKLWRDAGKTLAIYSSGSVLAQQLLFKYSLVGDLTSYLSQYFDTQVGAKRQQSSYLEISKQLGVACENIVFLSDIEEELIAANEAGMQVALINRDNSKTLHQFSQFKNFTDLRII